MGDDPITPLSIDAAGPEHTLNDRSIAIQKSVANRTDATNTPGDVLEYTLAFQVSDFFAFNGVTLTDIFSDGQRFDATFTPTLSIAGNTFSLPAAGMAPANFTVVPNYTPASPAPNDGTTTITFRVSDEIVSRGQPTGRAGRWVRSTGRHRRADARLRRIQRRRHDRHDRLPHDHPGPVQRHLPFR